MRATTPSRDDLRAYRRYLESVADRLSGGVAQLTAEATRPTGAAGVEAEDPLQEPTVTSSEGDEEVARGVLMSEEKLLAEIRQALARFDAGTFGRCERCGRSVGKMRLNALPYARHCIRCANTENDNLD